MTRLALALRRSCGVLVFLAACGGDSNTSPETGSVHVVVATIGAELDPDGYTVLVDGTARGHVASQADSTLTGLPVGSVSVNLSGVAGNCHATTPLPIAVNVSASQTVDASVTIACAATMGFLRLTLGGPTGQDQDADGYLYSIDGSTPKTVDIPGVVVPVATGDHQVVISGLAANCEILPSPELDFYVGPADTTEVQFAVGCSYITGAIQVFTATTGPRLDPDGYSVKIDGGAPVSLGINDNHIFTGIVPGTHDVEISGIAPNCILFAPNVVQATIGAGSWSFPLQFTFPVECPEVGTLRVVTPIVPQTPNGFAFFVGDASYPLGVSDTTFIPNIPVGSHSFTVRIPEDGCIATPNSGTFTIAANAFTDLTVTLNCPPP